ncbi:MAG: DUF1993 family protein [Lentilitoribacter sp.]
MSDELSNATVKTVKYYLTRIEHILKLLSRHKDREQLLEVKLADDMLDTGLNFAIAIKFAARTLCPPAKLDIPEIPDDRTCTSLLDYLSEIKTIIDPIQREQLTSSVDHIAGEGKLEQDAADYITKFGFPNMIFHLTMAYAGLRHAGFNIGKADFDGLHVY